ncbi:MAG: DUF3592 domain-containing protein [Candidatus Omnitrophica bacterium]|nr:DUF3592 domain-containing protein [Candidatus Omnitrophota bacterium]
MNRIPEVTGPVGNPANVWSVFFILFGAYLFLPAFHDVYFVQSSGGWPITPGKVISAELEKRWPDRGDTFEQGYLARIWYVYTANNIEYMGHSIRLHDDYTKDVRSVESALKRYPVGQQIDVRYDPRDPTMSIVEKNSVPAVDCAKMGLGLLFVMFGALALVGSLKQEIMGR